jgi:hypothetical protein
MSSIFKGGEFAPGGILAMIGSTKLAVWHFVYWDAKEQKYKCRDRYA